MKKKIVVLLLLFMLSFNLTSFADAPKIEINGEKVVFDEASGAPFIDENSRTLVPFRKTLETFGAKVYWDSKLNTAIAVDGYNVVSVPIGKNEINVNGSNRENDSKAIIINGRTYLPIRVVLEAFGAEVSWDGNRNTVVVKRDTNLEEQTKEDENNQNEENKEENKEVKTSNLDFEIGNSIQSVKQVLGEPNRIDPSEYGFEWYIYNSNYKKYIQIGVLNEEVVAIYSNSPDYKLVENVSVGDLKGAVEEKYGETEKSIKKGNTFYNMKVDELSIYKNDNSYARLFYDKHDSNKLVSALLIKKDVEESFKAFVSEGSKELKESYERQSFDLANASRALRGLEAYVWDDKMKASSEKHSRDMADNDFFAHNNLNGETPFDRMKNEGVKYRTASENIASGYQSAIFAHEGWMNSEGHRKNILGKTERLGVGVEFGGTYGVYYTQNFYTPY